MIRSVDDLNVVDEERKGIKNVYDLSNALPCTDLERFGRRRNRLKRKLVPFTFETCVNNPRVDSRWEVGYEF